jgi:hypothetical protein
VVVDERSPYRICGLNRNVQVVFAVLVGTIEDTLKCNVYCVS